MKTFLVLSFLVVGSGLADASTQTKLDPDKPPRLYVETYQLDFNMPNQAQYIDKDQYGNLDSWGNANSWPMTSYHWRDGSGGSGSQSEQASGSVGDSETSSSYSIAWTSQQAWPASFWPNLVDGTQTASGDYDWAVFDPIIDPPDIIFEHCDINFPVGGNWANYQYPDSNIYENGGFSGNYFRNADVVLKLQTGGKSVSSRQNLFLLTASATSQTPTNESPSVPDVWFLPNAVSPQKIRIDSMYVGSDGNLWRTYADNDTRDVTPQVSGVDYYTFSVGAQKYELHIDANGHNLDHETPEFCVGQQVTFTLNGLPTSSIVDMVGNWQLPDKFVNEKVVYWNGSPECDTYDINDSLLKNVNQTSCWFVNKPGGHVSVGLNLQFSNGQSVSVADNGDFTVFRPTVTASLDSGTTPSFFAGLHGAIPGIQLGGDGDPRDGAHEMAYHVSYDTTSPASGTPYTGTGGIVQLLTANFSARPSKTFSDWRLDGNSILYSSQHIDPDDSPPDKVAFDDEPQNYQPFIFSTIWVIGSFQDYCVYQPDGNGSIYVTLGIVTWSCDGEVRPSNLGEPGFPDALIITTNQVSGPTGPDSSDAFPEWLNTCPE